MHRLLSPTDKITSVAKRLLAARLIRSIGQGALAVDFALYLNALHWSGFAIGALLTVTGVGYTFGSIASGTVSDRIGRKGLILIYDFSLIGVGLLAASFQTTWVIVVCAMLGGFGRGGNGSAGPFSPVEQAWLARETSPQSRAHIYSLNSAMGFYGMATGALIAGTPYLFARIFPGPDSYRPLFVLSALCAAGVVALILPAADSKQPLISTPSNADPALKDTDAAQKPTSEHKLSPDEKKSLFVIASMNSLNATAIGLIGPLINYWFYLRFGVGPEVLGPFMALMFLVTAFAAHVNIRLAAKFGLINSVVYCRAAGLVLLLIFPLAPTFGIAAAIYLVRSLLNRGTIGSRSAVTANMVRPEHAGAAFSTSTAAAQFPMAIGPILAGPLIQAGWFETPFYVASFLQAIYVSLYKKAFTRAEPEPLSEPGKPTEPESAVKSTDEPESAFD